MEANVKCILLQLLETMLEQQRVISDLARDEELLIEAIQKPSYPGYAVVASEAVHSTADSVLGLDDKLQRLRQQIHLADD